MGTRTTNNKSDDFEKAPEGMHIARCYRVIDVGTHMDKNYGKPKRLGYIFFELKKTMDNGKPFSIAKRYTLSHNERSILRADLESWYGKKFNDADLDAAGGFDLERLLGRPALINIIHDDKYVNIKSINPLPEDMSTSAPELVNEKFGFWMPDDLTNPDKLAKLSERMRKMISESMEATDKPKPSMAPLKGEPGFDDDIPF